MHELVPEAPGLRITVSIGIASFPADAKTHASLIGLADEALYQAKKAGRNAWVGLLGTPSTSVEGVVETLQTDPDTAPEAGVFEIRRSTDHQPAEMAV